MRVFDRSKMESVALELTRHLREYLEWRDGERVASVSSAKPGKPLSARLDLRDDHLQDISSGDGYEWLGKRLAFKLMPELRKRLNGYKTDPRETAKDFESESGNGYVVAEIDDSPFRVRLKARECRWRDESGYNRGAGDLIAELIVDKDAASSEHLVPPRFERPPRPVNPITHVR
jgi:hypothetical protein